MKQLQEKFYTREEIGVEVGFATSNHNFARKVQDTLTNWGYSYEYSRKGVKITRVPTTPEEKLSEIIFRYYKIDVRISAYDFACFIMALNSEDGGFLSAPWGEREDYMKEVYGVKVTERTLRNWCGKLIKSGMVRKDLFDRSYWKTYYVAGIKCREEVEINDKDRLEYWKRFWELKKAGEEDIAKVLWREFGCCYYSCKSLLFSAWDENGLDIIEEVVELASQVTREGEKEIKIKVDIKMEKDQVEIKEVKEELIPIPQWVYKQNTENFELVGENRYKILATGKIGYIE